MTEHKWQPIETAGKPTKNRGQEVIDPAIRIKRLSEVDLLTGCWNWKGAIKGINPIRRYGSLIVGSRTNGTRRTARAHRFSYETFVGNIENGLSVLHLCDNPSCVNPDHLFLGTQQDNVDDRESKGRNKILIGSENGRSKLNDEKVLEARKMRVNGVGLTAIAKHFSVTKKTIYNVVHENTWKHVQPPEPPKELA